MRDEFDARRQDLRCLEPAVVPTPHRRLHEERCEVLISPTPVSPICDLTLELSGGEAVRLERDVRR